MPKQTWKTLAPQLRLVWQLSLPAILTQITTIAMQYIDSAMVGALGADASAAIGLVASSTWLFGGVTAAVSAGFSVQVAHRIGAGEDTEARTVVRHGLAAALTLAALLALLGLGICRQLPCWLGGGAEICADASAYFLTFSLMLPFSQLNSLTAGFLQCAGDMVTPSVLNAVMCGLDVVCNALLIPHFGVLGAGMGTALACALVSLAMAWCCCVRNAQLRLRRGETHAFRPEILKKAFRIGAPVAVQEIAMNGAMVASTMILAPLGAAAIAANSFAVTAESLCYMPGYGVGSAATTLVGRSVGAGDAAQARRYGNICTALGGALMGCTGLLMMIFCPFVFRLLTPVAEVRTLAAQALRIGLLAEPLFGVSIAAAGALRGAGDTLVPSLLNLGSIWIVRLGLSLLLVGKLGLRGMWIAMAIELCVRGTLMLWRQKTSKFYETQSKLHGG
ncbi:MAG: MATE family efflux transporter [Oscillospiraceae bacterium]|nr:MATE family efflux transporter [Clostridiales bacterium]MDY2718008.1 MATE family efflux transporter [Oscillospiraceae bacterium]